MSRASDDNGEELPDATLRGPASGGASGDARPTRPAGPPPPPEAFRPAGPPPPADSFRPGRPMDETAATVRPGRPDSPAGPTRQEPYGPYAPFGSSGTGEHGTGEHGTGEHGTGGYPLAMDKADRAGATQGGRGAEGRYFETDLHSESVRDRDRAGAPADGVPTSPPPGRTRTQQAPRPRRRRWPKIVAIVAVVLLVLLVVADRVVATVVAPNALKKEIAASLAESNPNPDPTVPPAKVGDVSIGGIPFLTQVIFGVYKDIRLTVTDIPAGDIRIQEVRARLQGLHVPFGDAVRDQVGAVPVDKVEGSVVVTYADLQKFLEPQVRKFLGDVNDRLGTSFRDFQLLPAENGSKIEFRVTTDVPGLGERQLSGIGSFVVTDGMLSIGGVKLRIVDETGGQAPGAQPTKPPDLFGGALGDLGSSLSEGFANLTDDLVGGVLAQGVPFPDISLPITGLPFDIRIESAGTNETGLFLTASARNITLPAG